MVDFSIPNDVVEYILLGPTQDRRQLQDSPILGDVWMAYAGKPTSSQDLLIRPHRDTTAADVAREVAERFERIVGRRRTKRGRSANGPAVGYLQGIVAAKLSFEAVIRILVPLTLWWQDHDVWTKLATDAYLPKKLGPRIAQIYSADTYVASRSQAGSESPSLQDIFTALDRYIALAGLILWAGAQRDDANGGRRDSGAAILKKAENKVGEILERLLQLYAELREAEASAQPSKSIFQISLNRRTWVALDKSVLAVKADAARTLFRVECDRIAWAILDSGIDGRHDAFKLADGGNRIRKTLDFTRIRDIVSSDATEMAPADLRDLLAGTQLKVKDGRDLLKLMAADAEARRPVNWGAVEQLITLKDPDPPTVAHGTHVAGILGAQAVGGESADGLGSGMCPGIRLYDFRVLAKTLKDTEFAVIGALQYIRYVNEQHNFITIHGANLSLSIPHSVRNYACGHTPVCIECERLVDSGVVVVAAAGNRGYHKFETSDGVYEGYAAFSITDPGNADGVITVGATHGNWPHTYGISFFSSRGPTGDGRVKPDLVAPGERVRSTVLGNEWGYESGTSMAAPHVSGAAAMLMSRYPELIGQPRRIKKILCDSATDLGRERTFQGHGMLDVLRAFQSI